MGSVPQLWQNLRKQPYGFGFRYEAMLRVLGFWRAADLGHSWGRVRPGNWGRVKVNPVSWTRDRMVGVGIQNPRVMPIIASPAVGRPPLQWNCFLTLVQALSPLRLTLCSPSLFIYLFIYFPPSFFKKIYPCIYLTALGLSFITLYPHGMK